MLAPNSTLLVADIGGTNARLGVAYWDSSRNAIAIAAIEVLQCADYADIGGLLDAYLRKLQSELFAAGQLPPASTLPRNACLAIAGPLLGNVGTLTNIGWRVDGDALAQQHNLDQVLLINDFAALAYSVPFLNSEEFIEVRGPLAGAQPGPISVAGAGTGFGVALLVPSESNWDLVAAEGGHVSFAPTSRRQQQVWEYLRGYEQHVCVEHILSGHGIVNIYQALANSPSCAFSAAEISERALAGSDPLCSETIELFCEIFGGVAGDIALTQGARGGIYLGGGILPKILPLFQRSRFVERFNNKGIMSDYVKALPIRLIISEYPALIGAAMWFGRA